MVIHFTVCGSCRTVLGTHDIPREPNGMAYIKQDGIHNQRYAEQYKHDCVHKQADRTEKQYGMLYVQEDSYLPTLCCPYWAIYSP